MYYRYARKWIDLFEEQPLMIGVETGHYIKGMHNLLNAHFDLRNFEGFDIALQAVYRICRNADCQPARELQGANLYVSLHSAHQPVLYAGHV